MITDQLVTNWTKAVKTDPVVRLATRYATFSSLLEIGDESLLLRAQDGEISFVKTPTLEEPWDFAFRGSVDAWQKFRLAPTPTTNHPMSMAYQGHMALANGAPNYFRMEGNYQKLFAHMPALCAILDQFRGLEG